MTLAFSLDSSGKGTSLATADILWCAMQHLVGGLLGLIFAMLLESVLLIIRSSIAPRSRAEESLLRHEREVQEAKLSKQRAAQIDEALRGTVTTEADGVETGAAPSADTKKEQ